MDYKLILDKLLLEDIIEYMLKYSKAYYGFCKSELLGR
jgi:hypothetical protein